MSSLHTMRLARVCAIGALCCAAGMAGTVSTYFSRDTWELAAGPIATENFATTDPANPTMNFATLALTSAGQSSSSSDSHPHVKHVDTSYIDLLPVPGGGNFVGTVGRTSASGVMNTYTRAEWCKDGVCVEDPVQETTTWYDYSDVRSLQMDFAEPMLYFGFDYVAYLSGSSPDRMTHPFRMILTFIDGTTSRAWVGGRQEFSPYQEGFMGVIADRGIRSATLRATDRYVSSNYSSSATDWTYQLTKRRKGDYYISTFTETLSDDQSSALWITNLTLAAPEPAPAALVVLGGALLAILRRRPRRERLPSRCRPRGLLPGESGEHPARLD